MIENDKPTLEEALAHYGVLGMKWGVRKDNKPQGYGNPNYKGKKVLSDQRRRFKETREYKPRTISLKSKKGETVIVREQKKTLPAAFIAAISEKQKKKIIGSSDLRIEVGGKEVGDAWVDKKGKNQETMYFNWIGVKPSERGKGYASAVFEAGIAFAKQEGCTKITLEVPGNAPDAMHIYKKNGFTQSGPVIDPGDPIWGGLTPMSLDISKKKIRHSEEPDSDELEQAFIEHFDVMYSGASPSEETLQHYGVLGMKWGVRKDRLPQGYGNPGYKGKKIRVKDGVRTGYSKAKKAVENRPKLTDKQKKVVKRAVIATVAVASVYIAIKTGNRAIVKHSAKKVASVSQTAQAKTGKSFADSVLGGSSGQLSIDELNSKFEKEIGGFIKQQAAQGKANKAAVSGIDDVTAKLLADLEKRNR